MDSSLLRWVTDARNFQVYRALQLYHGKHQLLTLAGDCKYLIQNQDFGRFFLNFGVKIKIWGFSMVEQSRGYGRAKESGPHSEQSELPIGARGSLSIFPSSWCYSHQHHRGRKSAEPWFYERSDTAMSMENPGLPEIAGAGRPAYV